MKERKEENQQYDVTGVKDRYSWLSEGAAESDIRGQRRQEKAGIHGTCRRLLRGNQIAMD